MSESATCERCGRELGFVEMLRARQQGKRITTICAGCLAIGERIAEEERRGGAADQDARDHLAKAYAAAGEYVRSRAKLAKLREREAKMRDLEIPVRESEDEQRPSDGEQDEG